MIRIAIAGYGNLGRGVEYAVEQNEDMELAAIFTRRPAAEVKPRTPVPVVSVDDAAQWADRVDVLILCGGSATDLPVQGPKLARLFNTVDSFDTHPGILAYFAEMDAALRAAGKLGLVSAGWDPGLFSLNRLFMSAVLPRGQTDTFWGPGVSQGHSDALRRVEGVLDAVQYTHPVKSAVEQVRAGAGPKLSAGEKHTRECFVVLKDGADAARAERDIAAMPYYFAGYRTTVHFITSEELRRDHHGMASEGFVYRSGHTGDGSAHTLEYTLKLGSNPAFTAGVLAACARAVHRMAAEGGTGALTLFDVPPALLSAQSGAELRKELL